MKLKNTLIVVKDIVKAAQFYHDLFGLEMTDRRSCASGRKVLESIFEKRCYSAKQFL